MWNLKFKVRNVDSVYSYLTEKFKVIDYMYPVDRFKKNNHINILGIHILFGDLKEKEKFSLELEKNKKVKEFKKDENRVVALVSEEEKFYELLFDPELFLTRPVVIENGIEHWNIAAWDRSKLTDLIDEMEKWSEKLQDLEILSIHTEDLKEIYFPRILPKLADQQKKAFRIAVKNGYYKFPREVDLEDLAGLMKISTQTYHEHLRKAEAKLLPYFFESGREKESDN